MKIPCTHALLLVLLCQMQGYDVVGAERPSFDETRMRQMIERVKGDARALADQVELLHNRQNRCDYAVQAACKKTNYHICASELPSKKCFSHDDMASYVSAKCTCGQWIDEEHSVVDFSDTIAPDLSRIVNPDVAEAICFSHALDEYWVAKRPDDWKFWSGYGVSPPQSYFGVSIIECYI